MKHPTIRLTRRDLGRGVALSWLIAPGAVRAEQGLIALRGFDAVSYFLFPDGPPLPGRLEFSRPWQGRSWCFASRANLAAFSDSPSSYAPRLGGYDPVGVLEGRLVDTDPLVFAILPGPQGNALYLFRNGEHRARIASAPALALAAEERWPGLRPLTEDGGRL